MQGLKALRRLHSIPTGHVVTRQDSAVEADVSTHVKSTEPRRVSGGFCEPGFEPKGGSHPHYFPHRGRFVGLLFALGRRGTGWASCWVDVSALSGCPAGAVQTRTVWLRTLHVAPRLRFGCRDKSSLRCQALDAANLYCDLHARAIFERLCNSSDRLSIGRVVMPAQTHARNLGRCSPVKSRQGRRFLLESRQHGQHMRDSHCFVGHLPIKTGSRWGATGITRAEHSAAEAHQFSRRNR